MNWKQRFFVLSDADGAATLHYYANEHGKALGKLELHPLSFVERCAKFDHGIVLYTPSRIMYLRAASDEDRSMWIDKLQEVMPRHVIPPFAGSLEKQGHVVRSWKKRFFILFGHTLTYYNSEAGTFCGMVGLKDSSVCPVEFGGRLRCFVISGSNKHMTLQAPDDETFEAWRKAVQKAVETGGIRMQGGAEAGVSAADDDAAVANDTTAGSCVVDSARGTEGSSFVNDAAEIEEAAATKIQASFRGLKAREERKKMEEAAIKIQSQARAHQARKEVGSF